MSIRGFELCLEILRIIPSRNPVENDGLYSVGIIAKNQNRCSSFSPPYWNYLYVSTTPSPLLFLFASMSDRFYDFSVYSSQEDLEVCFKE